MQLQFNAAQVAPESTPEALPLDWYPVTITDAEQKPTKDGTSQFLQLTLKVSPGHPFAGREQFDNLNLWNQNATAVEIAWKRLSAICHVTGQINLQDTRQLVGIPFQAKIGPQKTNPQYSEVKAVKDAQGNDPGKQGAVAAPVAPAPVQVQAPAAPVQAWAPPAAQVAYPAQAPAAPWGAPLAQAQAQAPSFAPNVGQTPAWQQGAAPVTAPWAK
jgi:hypothetical protein